MKLSNILRKERIRKNKFLYIKDTNTSTKVFRSFFVFDTFFQPFYEITFKLKYNCFSSLIKTIFLYIHWWNKFKTELQKICLQSDKNYSHCSEFLIQLEILLYLFCKISQNL